MRQTIAIITTADTKFAELDFLRDYITQKGYQVLTIDTSTRPHDYGNVSISSEKVLDAGGYSLEVLRSKNSKAEKIEVMRVSLGILIRKLYSEGSIHAVLGLGGLQNSVMNSYAMQVLPIGFPKVLLSTVACGSRTCGSLVGSKDIMLLPSIADLTGINSLTRIVLENAAGAVMGMLEHGGNALPQEGAVIGATMMGATSDGIVKAIQLVEEQGYEVITFHSTGIGGQSLENLIKDGFISAVLDLCLHEIVSQDVFNLGFSTGAKNRLVAAVEKNLPMVLSPAGLDFIDCSVEDFHAGILGDPGIRKYTLHNNDIAHVKLLPHEAEIATNIVIDRLKEYMGTGVMILPLKGLRSETQPGEKLHAPEVDQVIFKCLKEKLNKNIQIIEIDAHLFDTEFSVLAANEMIRLMRSGSHLSNSS